MGGLNPWGGVINRLQRSPDWGSSRFLVGLRCVQRCLCSLASVGHGLPIDAVRASSWCHPVRPTALTASYVHPWMLHFRGRTKDPVLKGGDAGPDLTVISKATKRFAEAMQTCRPMPSTPIRPIRPALATPGYPGPDQPCLCAPHCCLQQAPNPNQEPDPQIQDAQLTARHRLS